MDGKNEKRRGRSSSYAAEERLDYCCKEGVSQHKQPLGSQHCLTPFRAPTPQPLQRTHLATNSRIYTQDYVHADLPLTPCTSHHLATRD